jgi:ABC-type amino acid transport system permease subunit
MIYLEIILLIVGIVLLIIGYRKTDRNLMLAAAVVLWLSASIHDIVSGAIDAASSSQERQSTTEIENRN